MGAGQGHERRAPLSLFSSPGEMLRWLIYNFFFLFIPLILNLVFKLVCAHSRKRSENERGETVSP